MSLWAELKTRCVYENMPTRGNMEAFIVQNGDRYEESTCGKFEIPRSAAYFDFGWFFRRCTSTTKFSECTFDS